MTTLNVAPLRDDVPFGAQITGVTRDNLRDPEIRDEIGDLFQRHGLLIFSEVEPSSDMQVELGGTIGPLRGHAMAEVASADVGAAALLMELHNDPEDQKLYEVDGRVQAGITPWHFDGCYSPQIYRGGALRALEIAPEGGETGFADGVQLYQAISPALRARFEDLSIIYDPGLMYGRQKFGFPKGHRFIRNSAWQQRLMTLYERAPRAIHPAIWERSTGERVLHVSPWQAAGIEGHEDPESDALLEELCQEIYEKMQPYWHRWRDDQVVVWDNWRLLHAVSGHDPACSRRVQRANIEGDYGLGRPELVEHGV